MGNAVNVRCTQIGLGSACSNVPYFPCDPQAGEFDTSRPGRSEAAAGVSAATQTVNGDGLSIAAGVRHFVPDALLFYPHSGNDVSTSSDERWLPRWVQRQLASNQSRT